MKTAGRVIAIPVALLLAAGFGWLVFDRIATNESLPERGDATSTGVPVEVAAIRHGPMELQRTFSGTLEAQAEFVVAPKVSGRVEKLYVNLADTVTRDQVVAELDDAEHVQAVVQAGADLAVAEANVSEAQSALEIANRELERIGSLRERGISSETQFDVAKAAQLTEQAQLEVARAMLRRAEAALETANIRFSYTKVKASWSGGSDRRIVAERHVDEGDTVAANAALLRIVELDPITGVFFATEKDYARLRPGQPVVLTTDTFPGERFRGSIVRIAPVFQETTRQARIELTVDNPRRRLKPGMFIRATVVLEQIPETVSVPEQALAVRDDQSGVFIVASDGQSAVWRPVEIGIRQGDAVEIKGEGLSGQVVTLGQQLLDDGSPILIAADADTTSGTVNDAQ